MLVCHLYKTAGTALKKLQANILLQPTYIALINTGEWKRHQEKRDASNDTTPQKPGAESSHRIVSYRPLHQHTEQHDLYTHMLLQLSWAWGRAILLQTLQMPHAPSTVSSKVSTFVSSTSLVQENRENRRKKLYMKTALSVISARKTKDHYRCQMGVISFSRKYCNITINFPFLLNWGDIFCSESDSYGLVQSCSKIGLAYRESFKAVSDGLTPS